METKEVSIHQVRVYVAAETHGGWLTSKELAALAGVAQRTARHHALALSTLGILETADVFPGRRYRVARVRRNPGYLQRIDQARDIFHL